MRTNEPVRNHRSVVVKNVISLSLIILIMTLGTVDPLTVSISVAAVLICAVSAFCYIYWAKTFITITDEDIIVERNTLFKKKKTIPYSKIATINADRDILDRILGTTKLKININSSRNATIPEAVFTFGKEFADEARKELSERIFSRSFDKEEYDSAVSAVEFSGTDVVLHGLISLSTYQTVITIVMIAYSFIAVFLTEASLEGVAAALAVVAVVEVLPMFSSVIRYYGFTVFRTGDTIHLRHGAIQNYNSSFEIQRVNAVCIKRTLFARILGKAYIEAEVVGIAGENGKIRPMISLLSKESNIDIIMKNILPEFIYERSPEKQPSSAMFPMAVNNAITAAAAIAVLALAFWFTAGYMDDAGVTGLPYYSVTCGLIALMFITVITAIANIPLSLKRLEFDMGEDLFTFGNGIVDQETVTMNYDKVQVIEIRSGIPAKKRGLARCRASLLSSVGGRKILSGYFKEEELAKLADAMIRRVSARLGK